MLTFVIHNCLRIFWKGVHISHVFVLTHTWGLIIYHTIFLDGSGVQMANINQVHSPKKCNAQL